MSNKIVALALVGCAFTSFSAFSQSKLHQGSKPQKVWVFLTDKKELAPKIGNQKTLARRTRIRVDRGWMSGLDAPVSHEYADVLKSRGAKIRVVSKWFNAVSIEASPAALQEIAALPFVLRMEAVAGSTRPREPVQTSTPPLSAFNMDLRLGFESSNDYGPSLNQVAQIRVPELHAKGLSGKGVTVALLDIGFRKNHEAFQNLKLVGEKDFVMNDGDVQRDPSNPNDYDDEHGTMTWSVLGGYAPGKIIGPAYGAQFLLARTEDGRSETQAEEDYWVAALEWAESHGADIVSSSLGYLKFDDGTSHAYESLDGQTVVTSQAANIAASLGVLVVNSVGNDGEDGEKTLSSPSDSFGVLAVGAVNFQGEIADFSSRGPTADGRIKPEVVANGVGTYMATNARVSSYGRANGTSFSAPLVAGVAALLKEAHPDWRPEQIKDALMRTASNSTSPDNVYGFGLVDSVAALNYQPPLAVAQAH